MTRAASFTRPGHCLRIRSLGVGSANWALGVAAIPTARFATCERPHPPLQHHMIDRPVGQAAIASYAKAISAPLRTHTTVTSVRRTEAGYLLPTDQGDC